MKIRCLVLAFCIAGMFELDGQPLQQHTVVRLFFVFSQPKYAPGDTAFFSLFIHARERSLVQGRYVVNLHLMAGNGTEVLVNRLLVENGVCSDQLLVPKNATPGVYTLTAYPDALYSESSRMYQAPFIIAGKKTFHAESGMHRSDSRSDSLSLAASARVSVLFDRPVYGTRNSVHANVQLDDSLTFRSAGHVVAVVLNDSLFGREIKHLFYAFPESATQSFVHDSVAWPRQKTYPTYFKAQISGAMQPLPDSTLVTFYLRKEDFIYGLYASKDGVIEFPLFKNFDDEEIFYNISSRGKILPNAIMTVMPQRSHAKPIAFVAGDDVDAYGQYAETRDKIMRSYKFYTRRQPVKNESIIDDDIDADFSVDLDKFETFETMAEVLGNIIQAAKYKRSHDKDQVRVFLKDGYYATGDPVYIIDGIMTDNTDYFLSLHPANVKKIAVMRSHERLGRYGVIGNNGIIMAETRIPNHRNSMPRTEKSLFITKINKELDSDTPLPRSQYAPDMRAMLYWNPHLIVNNHRELKLTFETGDSTGIFWFVVMGITSDGMPFWSQTKFVVEYQPH